MEKREEHLKKHCEVCDNPFQNKAKIKITSKKLTEETLSLLQQNLETGWILILLVINRLMLCANAIMLCVNAMLVIYVCKCESCKCKCGDKGIMNNHITMVHKKDDSKNDCAEKSQKRNGTGAKQVRFDLLEDKMIFRIWLILLSAEKMKEIGQ